MRNDPSQAFSEFVQWTAVEFQAEAVHLMDAVVPPFTERDTADGLVTNAEWLMEQMGPLPLPRKGRVRVWGLLTP